MEGGVSRRTPLAGLLAAPAAPAPSLRPAIYAAGQGEARFRDLRYRAP